MNSTARMTTRVITALAVAAVVLTAPAAQAEPVVRWHKVTPAVAHHLDRSTSVDLDWSTCKMRRIHTPVHALLMRCPISPVFPDGLTFIVK